MAIETQRYLRKPLYVDAVRITSANFNEVASWCQGEVLRDEVVNEGFTGKKYIKVRVHNPKNPRQTKAFVGDWLLYTERGYKVYTTKAFHSAFDKVGDSNGTEPTRVLTVEEQKSMSINEIGELVHSGEAVREEDSE